MAITGFFKFKKRPGRFKPVNLVLVGGGSGGHVAPLLALAKEIKKAKLNWHLTYIGAGHDQVARRLITADNHLFYDIRWLPAGKFRRYSGSSGRPGRRLTDLARNLVDGLKVGAGLIASLYLIGRLRPDLVFSKGGFAALGPLLASRFWRLPVVGHDSDTIAGLTHRLNRSGIKVHLTGLPKNNPAGRSRYVGIPIADRLSQKPDQAETARILAGHGLPADSQLILAFGGSSGALAVNQALIGVFDQLELKSRSRLLLVTGLGHFQAGRQQLGRDVQKSRSRIQLVPFLNHQQLVDLIRVAQIVIIRAGATSLAEVSAAGKAALVIPKPFLPGNHQIHNANVYRLNQAITVVADNGQRVNRRALTDQLNRLINNQQLRTGLAGRIKSLARTDASHQTLEVLREVLAGRLKSSLLTDGQQRRYYFRYRVVVGHQQSKVIAATNAQIKQQKRAANWRFGVFLISLLGLIVLARVSYIGSIRVDLLPSDQPATIDSLQLEKIDDYLNRTVLPEVNFFQFNQWWRRHYNLPEAAILGQLQQNYPLIESLQLKRDWWQSSVTVRLKTRPIIGVISHNGEIGALTSNGLVAQISPEIARNPDQFVVSLDYPEPIRLSDYRNRPLLGPESIRLTEDFVGYFKAQGRRLSRLSLSDNPYQLVFGVAGYDEIGIIASPEIDGLLQAAAANASFNYFESHDQPWPQQYIDVREITRGLYK